MSENSKTDNRVVYKKLKTCFKNNIKVALKIFNTIFLITQQDKFYKINIDDENIPSFIFENNTKFLDSKIVQNLSDKEIIDFNFVCYHYKNFNFVHSFIARTKEKIYFFDDYQLELREFISELNVDDIKYGALQTVVLTSSGEVYVYGNKIRADNSYEEQLRPVKMNGFNDEKIVMISCGWGHSLALTESGHVYSWGKNKYGQLGLGTIFDATMPKLIEMDGIKFKKIECGKWHSLLLANNGAIYAFGDNDCGQIGNDDKQLQKKPVKLNQFMNEKIFIDIASHPDRNISASLSNDNVYYVWGECKSEIILKPKKTIYESFNDVFNFNASIQYKSSEKLIKFDHSLFRFGHYKENFNEIKKLGGGGFGIVFEVTDKNSNSYAIKKIENVYNLMKEYRSHSIASSLKSEYLLEQFDIWFENIQGKQILFVKMELCDMTLEQIKIELHGHFNYVNAIALTPVGHYIASVLFIEILNGVRYLHQNSIIHRDLKPANILVKKGENNKYIVKIADFGFIVKHQSHTSVSQQSHTNDKGTPTYMAPEMYGRNYNTKADIYSLGKIFAELINLDIDCKYEDKETAPILLMVKYRESLELYNRMTFSSPFKRPTCEEIIKEKGLWAFDKNDSDVENGLREMKNLSAEKRNSYIHALLESKVNP